MTKKQKSVVLLTVLALTILALSPPYHEHRRLVDDRDKGHWMTLNWHPPDAHIHVDLLLVYCFFVISIGGGLWLFLKPRGNK